MIKKIRKYIDDKKDLESMFIIYNTLKKSYNEHDIKFVLLTYYDFDIELEMHKEKEERDKRYYQQILRKQAYIRYQNKCVISDINEKILLEVAHIKPVSECSNEQEKTDINNVLLLWIDIHKFFDAYLISINPKTLTVETKCEYLKKYNGMTIKINEQTRKYLENHYSKFISINKV